MELIQERLKNPLYAGIAGFVVGLIIGWFAIGWGIWPVQWTDAAPQHLRADAREDYLRMVIDIYNQTLDVNTAQRRWQELGPVGMEVLQAIEANPGVQNPAAIEAFKVAVAGVPAEGEEPAQGGGIPALVWACLVTLLLGGGVAAFYFFRVRGGVAPLTPAVQAAKVSLETERTDFEAMGQEPPLGQFMTTYMLGDDLFDDSFSIDSPSGEFLGECGVGIADTIGVGEPKRVSAYEVWLFDKNDIQTVTKVLMSSHAFNDMATRERLAAKGEPLPAETGGSIELETATLRLVARVVDMSYGDGALPEESFFERLTLELAVWSK
jgi:hypothetical protein